MPFIRISVAGNPPTHAQVAELQQKTTQLMAEILGKRPEVTVVAVESAAAINWAVGGKSLAKSDALAQMEAFITAGTNSVQEKADFISAAQRMICTVFDAEMSPLYVVVSEVDGADWGYDGKTQAFRKQSAASMRVL